MSWQKASPISGQELKVKGDRQITRKTNYKNRFS